MSKRLIFVVGILFFAAVALLQVVLAQTPEYYGTSSGFGNYYGDPFGSSSHSNPYAPSTFGNQPYSGYSGGQPYSSGYYSNNLGNQYPASSNSYGSGDFYGSRRGTASYVDYGASFTRYYGNELNTYWPILGNRDTCEARQDILIQISPLGCQPAVVRSDLLAEQNVPVFCQLDLLQINPAIDVKQIRSMRFNGKYPSYVSGVGFHPARAALRTRDRLLGSPLESNIGYVVVVLKKDPKEKELPDFFNFTLSATVDYYSGNAIGLGVSELLLRETNTQEWETAKNKQSFFKGKYSVRLLESDYDSAEIALYRGDEQTNTIALSRQGNQQTQQVYLPGSYCQTALQFSYSDFVSSRPIVKLQVDDDVFDVYEGARFLDNKCVVRRIYDVTSDRRSVSPSGTGIAANSNLPNNVNANIIGSGVEINCGRERIFLSNAAEILAIGNKVYTVDSQRFLVKTDEEWIIKGIDYKKQEYSIERTCPGCGDVEKKSVSFGLVRSVDKNVLTDATYGEYEQYILKAIQEYENVADTYGQERELANSEIGETLGERALGKAIDLTTSPEYEKKRTAVRLIEKYLTLYPSGDRAVEFAEKINDLYTLDSSASGKTVSTDDGVHNIKLVEIIPPTKKSNIRINWGGQELAVNQDETTQFAFGAVTLRNVRDAETVEVYVACAADRRVASASRPGQSRGGNVNLRLGETPLICESVMRLTNLDIQRFVKLRINPVTKTSTTGNFTVGIGIEKRA
ncbi:MAG: hypothetical protein AABY16_04215, partial [Nanoarchaeota archaeon]